MATVPTEEGARSRATARILLAVAVAAGLVHGLFSLYWAAGGDWLLSTVGRQMVDTFDARRWLLVPVAAVKIGFAVLPLVPARLTGSTSRARRLLCWTGVAVLVAWGGGNTIVANLVLSGVIDPSGGYDRVAMMGHAWLWDPLFLVWGIALAGALVLTRHRPGTSR